MKVAIVAPGGLDPSGERRVIPALLWLIERLSREAEVHAFTLAPVESGGTYTLRGATVHAVGPHLARAASAIRAEHARGRFQVIHAFWATHPAYVALPLGGLLGAPVMVHIAGGELASLPDIDYGGVRTWRGRAAMRAVLRSASVVTGASRGIIESAARLGCRAVRVPLGVARDAWPPCPPRARDTSRPARLIHVASLNRVKDPFTLIRALRLVADRGTSFSLDVAGEDTLQGAVADAAHQAGLADCITFHGFRTQGELRPMVLAADVMVISSRHEAGPIAALEAAVSGVAVAGTAVGHLAEWAPHAAAVAPPGDAEALAHAIDGLLRDETRRLAIAGAAQEHSMSEDADFTASRVMGLYREMAAAR